MAVSPERVATYEYALASAEPLMTLRQVIAEELESRDGDRAALLNDLEQLRVMFREAGRETAEDIVLEAMDFVTGWCSPHMRV